MSAEQLTAIGGIVVPLLVLGAVPWLLKRQTNKRDRELAEKAEIKERAEREALAAAGDVVSWEKINRALATTAQEERAAHRERLAELRETFLAEAERLKRHTDSDMDRARAEIARMGDQIRALEARIAQMASPGDR